MQMVRKALFAALALASLSLGGCAALQAPSAVASATAIDEKALYAAEALYNVPAQAYVVADGNGQLSPELKAVLKPKLQEAYRVLLAIRAAYAAGNAAGFASQVVALHNLSGAIVALIPK
jgi:hypothetical protein